MENKEDGAELISANDTGHGDTLPRPSREHLMQLVSQLNYWYRRETYLRQEAERVFDDHEKTVVLSNMAFAANNVAALESVLALFGYRGNQPLSEASGSAQSEAP